MILLNKNMSVRSVNTFMDNCKVCSKPLKTWYGLGGMVYQGCSDIKCNYKKEKDIKIEDDAWYI